MKTRHFFLAICLLLPLGVATQPLLKPSQYNIEKEKVLYTVGYAHLDTEWNWDYPTTINVCIKNIMEENFKLFEKYPDYVFNFTGSRRYQMMKDYYPDLYKKVKDYVKQGRWHVSGSSVDEGEVNVPSAESLIRQVLYGNNFFRREFGKESSDYILPDCFGFLGSMPSIWNHCGLIGFSTQKLTWKSAMGVPFNVGIWNGPDGKGIVAAFNATDYNGSVVPRLDKDGSWVKRMEENEKKYGLLFDYRYYGVGDEGGAPRENDVRNVVGSLHNADSKLKVILTSSDQMYKDITPEIRKKLPTYSGDLLLIEHSAGSLTSQAYMKRSNRKNEQLAQSAEQVASAADFMKGATYPFAKLNNAWDLVLGSQFHDILPGTSIPKAYEYAWNDEFVAANGFSEVLKNSLRAVSENLNTSGKGRSLVVYNPVATEREDVVTAELSYTKLPKNIKVLNPKGDVLKSQIIERKDNKLKFIFIAKLPSVGLATFDVCETNDKPEVNPKLLVSNQSLENEFYKVKIAANGDIESIWDKKVAKEILSKPARLEFLRENPEEWPAWNMDWADRQKAPVDYLDKNATVKVLENGSARVSLLITRKGMNSEIEQIISLAAGDAGKRIEISNLIDWQSKEVSLKASFPLTVSNQNATYNYGVGTVQRNNNHSTKFEVPSKEWFDLTDLGGKYGVSILEDCKFGSDKPNDNTLRLTLLFTPAVKWGWFYPQATQDFGFQEFKYGIYGHQGDWASAQTPWQAKFLNQPLVAFETSAHKGNLGKEVSLLKSNSPQVGVMAFKKMEDGDFYLVRVNELQGKDAKGINIAFAGKITDAYEVNGQEKKIGEANFKNGILNFDITHYTMRSFAVKIQPAASSISAPDQQAVTLPYNFDMMSTDDNRSDISNNHKSSSYPSELIPTEIVSEDIHFKTENSADRLNNTVEAKGQKINLPEGNFTKLYLLAAATRDTAVTFIIDEKPIKINIQNWTGYIGQHYNRVFNGSKELTNVQKPYLKTSNIAWFTSHRHFSYPMANEAYQYCYMYKYELQLPKGAKTLTLPDNKMVRIFAATVSKNEAPEITVTQPLFDEFKDSKPLKLRTGN